MKPLQSELQDEALRTELRGDDRRDEAPHWLSVEDEVMAEHMSEGEPEEKVRDWLEQTVQPQDSVSMCGQAGEADHGEPMLRANHGASDQPARQRLWKYAQQQSNKDGRPRIPLEPNIRAAPDVESQAALRRGLAAEQSQQHRVHKRQQNWQRNRSRT